MHIEINEIVLRMVGLRNLLYSFSNFKIFILQHLALGFE